MGTDKGDSDVQKKFSYNLDPSVPNLSTITLLYTAFVYPIFIILFPNHSRYTHMYMYTKHTHTFIRRHKNT